MYSADLSYVHDVGYSDLVESAAPWILDLLRDQGIENGRIVEAGCGGGRLAERLVDAGYSVTGIDISPSMVRLARARVPRATFRVGSLDRTQFPRCNAILAIGEVVSYVPGGMRALRRFFGRAHDALAPGGLLVFDFMASGERRTFTAKSRAGADWAIVISAELSSRRRILIRRITIFRKVGSTYHKSRETHRVRIHTRDEMVTALERAGFSAATRRSYGRHRLLPGDLVVIAQKI